MNTLTIELVRLDLARLATLDLGHDGFEDPEIFLVVHIRRHSSSSPLLRGLLCCLLPAAITPSSFFRVFASGFHVGSVS